MSHSHSTEVTQSDGASLENRLHAFYTAVSRAMAFGHFKGHHGPLEETAWLHVSIHQLDEVDRLAAGVLDQDVRCLARLRTVIEQAPATAMSRAAPAPDDKRGTQVLHGREPAVVATVALLLDRLMGREKLYVDKALRYYAVRAAAVQQALDRAAAVVSGESPIDRFRDYVAQLNPLAAAAHAIHDEHTPVLDKAHDGEHSHSVSSRDVEAVFSAVIESAHSHGGAAESIAAACHCNALSAASKAKIELLSAFLRDNEAIWRRFLTESGTPVHVEPIVLPEPARHRCVPGQPQYGGQWEIASLRATETDELCPFGQVLHDAGSKAYAQAGADLIKAQNEWINAKECFGDADKKRGDCIKKEDHGYEHCAVEEDQGYEKCAREEDQGYRDCCDWWPCSWACDAWTWIKNIVCVLKEWVENWVCVLKTWVEKWVCVAWAYIVATGCAAGHLAKAAYHAAKGLGGIAIGAAIRTASGFVGQLCVWLGAKPSTREATQLKVVGIHLAVLHTNKVMLFAYDEGIYPVNADNPADFTAIGDSDRGLCALWDFRNGTAQYVKLNRNLFCAHQSFTEDGRLFVAGGQFPLPGLLKSLFPPKLLAPGADRDVHLFDPVSETWNRLPDMAKGRWYPTCVTLPSGSVLVASGTNGYATEAGFGRGIQDTWQIADPRTGNVGTPFSFGFHLYHLYPFLHVLPSGEVFIHFKRTTILFDPNTFGMVRVATGNAGPKQTGRTVHPYSRTGPGPGTCVLLPLLPRVSSTGEVAYPRGRIMILGGGGAEKEPEPSDETDQQPPPVGTGGYQLHSNTAATNTAEILDFSSPDREWRSTESMHHGRVMPDSVLLPNGKVLVVGGGSFGQSGGLLAHFTSTDMHGNPDKGATDPVLQPEIFDPETETWEELCPKSLERLYHTTAVLLPDARVLVAGHDGALNMPPYDASRYELEVFSPPYLFGPDGTPANRPAIVEAPANVNLAQRFGIRTREAAEIASVVLIRQSSTTHQINSDQRLVGLAIVGTDGDQLQVQMPSEGGVAPPGFYMLFLVDQRGVPSVAHWVRVNIG
jgi:hypothetical protein